MAYTRINMCANNLCKRTLLVELIIENVVSCLISGTQCINMCLSLEKKLTYSKADLQHRPALANVKI